MTEYQKAQRILWAAIERGEFMTAEQAEQLARAKPEQIKQHKPKRKSKLLRILCRLLK